MVKEKVVILSDVLSAEREALVDILDRLTGTPLERTGDIVFEINGIRYVVSNVTGPSTAVSVARPGGAEVLQPPSYRSELVQEVAALGVVKAAQQASGKAFTLKELIGSQWDDLSAVEQRNAGKLFREQLSAGSLRHLEDWKTSDNEWHYKFR